MSTSKFSISNEIRFTLHEIRVTMADKAQFDTTDDGLLVRAPAKINLSLLIAGKRPDGFHEIETIMAKINLFDELLIQPGTKPGVQFICKGRYWAPQTKENIIYQACQTLLEHCRSKADLKITLTKNIPAGAGLGSASSDAAAALLGLKKYLKLDITKNPLTQIAAELGSDVPFFLDGPLAICKGKGEKIKKIDKNFNFLALLILPNVSVPTKKIYNNYKHNQALYEMLSAQINTHIRKNRIDLASGMCANMLEKSCFDLYKGLAELKVKVESLGIAPLCLTGSGAALFHILEGGDEKKARQYKSKLKEKLDCKSIIVSNIGW